MTNYSYDQLLGPEDLLQGPWNWLQASSQPESATATDLSNLDLVHSTSEAGGWILGQETTGRPFAMAEFALSDLDSVLNHDILPFPAADVLQQQQQQRPDINAWLPSAEELVLGAGLDAFLHLHPLLLGQVALGVRSASFSNDCLAPFPAFGEAQQHDRSPVVDGSAAAGFLYAPFPNSFSSDAYPPSSSSTCSPTLTSSASSSPYPSPTPPTATQPGPTAAAHPRPSRAATFPMPRALRLQKLRHTRPIVCLVCTRRHANKKDMHRHMWTHHAADAARLGVPAQTRPCPVRGCGIVQRADNLNRHLRTVHPWWTDVKRLNVRDEAAADGTDSRGVRTRGGEV